MSNRHLPAGQSIPGGPANMGGVDMGGGGHSSGPRRRQPQYAPPYHHQPVAPMYANYVPYAPQQYYGMPPQYPGAGMASPGYMPYQPYGRSPPAMHPYAPMVGVSVPPNYPRSAQQQSPTLATPYQPPPTAAIPPPQATIPPQTPSSSHSSQMIPPPTPPTPQASEHAPSHPYVPAAPFPEPREAFRPPLPWLSCPEGEFPARTTRSRRRRRRFSENGVAVSLPSEQHGTTAGPVGETVEKAMPTADKKPAAMSPGRTDVTPALPKMSPQAAKAKMANGDGVSEAGSGADVQSVDKAMGEAGSVDDDSAAAPAPASPSAKAAPTSWANLFAKSAAHKANARNVNGHEAGSADEASAAVVGSAMGSSFSRANASSLAEAIRNFTVENADSVALLEPRGLINTGNMCYMNSVLQVLMFCTPFYDFLGQVSKRAAHSFKSETPLVDAMIMFMHEFKVLASSSSPEQLARLLKTEDFERYGEPFTPEFVYEAIRQLSRFASMRRGHQQDAEEFLGFLLQSLDDECSHIMNAAAAAEAAATPSDSQSEVDAVAPASGDWLEVGRRQKPAVTRSSGSNSSTPISKVFGGLLRSEFRVPGLKDSITTEPYQPLQLDIGSPEIKNVVDALRGLTRPERLQGDFSSPRGKDVLATKQVFIESLPPVLILHLKRFQFDAEGHGTIKIWKKVGYPLELEIPREVLSRQRRATIGDGAMPKYRLISVVYHHGKNASGGHYTVDVRRQDGREWIRMDDTVLRRIRSEDVAEGGAEEQAKDVRKDRTASPSSANRFGAMNEEDTGDDEGWNQVTASTSGSKKWSNVVNGASAKEKQAKDNIKDNKVAYLLFYQRM